MSSRCEMTAVSYSPPAWIRGNSTTFRIGGVTRNPSGRASRSRSVRIPRRSLSLAPLARNLSWSRKLTTLSAKRHTLPTKSTSAKPARVSSLKVRYSATFGAFQSSATQARRSRRPSLEYPKSLICSEILILSEILIFPETIRVTGLTQQAMEVTIPTSEDSRRCK